MKDRRLLTALLMCIVCFGCGLEKATDYNRRGVAKAKHREYKAAIELYSAAIRLDPDYEVAYNNRGVAKKHLGEYEAAIADYDSAIGLVPDDANAYFGRGLVKKTLNKTLEAIQDFQTALELAAQAGDVALKDDIKSFLAQDESNSEEAQADVKLKDDVESFLLQFK